MISRPIRPPVPSNSAFGLVRKGWHWTPEGHCGCLVYFFEHDPQQYDFQNYPCSVCFKNELLHPQKEKSPTCSNFEIFDHDPQLDMKFWNLTSNFETHKNIGQNFDYIYRYMYTLSMHHKGINIIEGYFGYQKWTFIPKKRKITYLLWFWNFWPRPPTWHEILKPIRILVTILISYTSRHMKMDGRVRTTRQVFLKLELFN